MGNSEVFEAVRKIYDRFVDSEKLFTVGEVKRAIQRELALGEADAAMMDEAFAEAEVRQAQLALNKPEAGRRFNLAGVLVLKDDRRIAKRA